MKTYVEGTSTNGSAYVHNEDARLPASQYSFDHINIHRCSELWAKIHHHPLPHRFLKSGPEPHACRKVSTRFVIPRVVQLTLAGSTNSAPSPF